MKGEMNQFAKYRFNPGTSKDAIVRPIGVEVMPDGSKLIHLGPVHGALPCNYVARLPELTRRTELKKRPMDIVNVVDVVEIDGVEKKEDSAMVQTRPVVKVHRKATVRIDLSKSQKRECFFLFYPEARNATGMEQGYPCIICKENLMYIDGTGSWNASHIRPIKHCPVKDPKYAIPTCTSCNGKMGVSKQYHINAFDMMVRYNYRDRIYPIAKVLRQRYDKNGLSVSEFVFQSYGRGSLNQEGLMDKYFIIHSKEVYEEISSREEQDLERERLRAIETQSAAIQEIHHQIKTLLLDVEKVRALERSTIMDMYRDLDAYRATRNTIFQDCNLFKE